MELLSKKQVMGRDFIGASRVLHESEVAGRYDVILDDPFATEEDTLQILDTLTKLRRPFWINVFSMTFFPNTEMYKMAAEKNLLPQGKNGYLRKMTHVTNSYLNNLVAISPLTPNFVVKFFLRNRKKIIAHALLAIFVKSYYMPVAKLMYLVSKYYKILSFLKGVHFRVFKLLYASLSRVSS